MVRSRGDTIVEVMFSFAIFSLVVVSTLVIMNQGLAAAQRSLEISLVRQQIDSQITMVKHAQQLKLAAWSNLKSTAFDSIAPFTSVTSCPSSSDITSYYFLSASPNKSTVQTNTISTSNYSKAVSYAMVDALSVATSTPKSYGIWLALVKAEGFAANHAYDLHVRACWDSVGTSVPITIGTVARIYDVN